MRVILLVFTFLILCSARFKTSGRSAKQEMQEVKPIKSGGGIEANKDEVWPFTETLRKSDPNLAELTRKFENENQPEVLADSRFFASILLIE